LQTLNFPIGAGTAYRPIVLALTQAAATATPFTAQIINGSVPSNTLAATIDKVSSVGYATLSGSNVASATVQLSYIAADNITDITNLRIAQGPVAGGGTWVDLGGTGSAVPAGTITSTPITDLTTNTVFVLANSIDGTNVLPIQLTSFTAIASGLNATLAWTTATETNNAGFAIERKIVNSQSSTVNSWSKIAFIIGNGTSAIAHSYSYTDASASAGTYDYRLKQIDADGTSSYSSESEVIVGAAAKALSLSNYPNPFNPSTSILFSVPADGNTIVKIYNIIGQEVATAFTGVATAGKYYKATFDGSRLASGVYYYSIQNNGQKMVKKMLMVK
jgi:hypothetical protein